MTWKPRSIWAATCVALTCALFINTSCAVMPSAIPPLATTIAATLAPTATSTVLDQHILWSADHETGDLSQWDGAWISATGDARISTDHAHSGRYSAALTVYNAVGGSESPGVRMAKVSTPQNAASLPDEAYYSVWYYFPQTVRPAEWWNIFQWKRRWERNGEVSSDPVYTIDVANRPDGAMYLYLYSEVGAAGNYNTAGVGARAAAAIDLPLNRWVHLE